MVWFTSAITFKICLRSKRSRQMITRTKLLTGRSGQLGASPVRYTRLIYYLEYKNDMKLINAVHPPTQSASYEPQILYSLRYVWDCWYDRLKRGANEKS